MKWLVLLLTVVSSAAFADDACARSCDETVKECQNVCKKTLKKEAPDKVKFCQEKCKEFENECKKECKQSGQ